MNLPGQTQYERAGECAQSTSSVGKPDGLYGAREESTDEKHLQELKDDFCRSQGWWEETMFLWASIRTGMEVVEKSDSRWGCSRSAEK